MRRLLHNMIRKHVALAVKPGVGAMQWCVNRFTRTPGLHVQPDDGTGEEYYLNRATRNDWVNLSMAKGATDLRTRMAHAAVCAACCD